MMSRMHDEGPSSDDLKRFADDTAYCPECGAEIWDGAEFCPECGEHVAGRVSGREPIERGCRQQWIVLIVIVVLIAFLMMVVL